MKGTLSVTYALWSMIPGVKSWGCLPEHSDLTLAYAKKLAREWRADWPKTRIRVVRTLVSVIPS